VSIKLILAANLLFAQFAWRAEIIYEWRSVLGALAAWGS